LGHLRGPRLAGIIVTCPSPAGNFEGGSMKFRKKPVVIEAMKWTGKNTTELLHWIFPDIEADATADHLTIKTLEGELYASVGDWIIKGIKGEFYPCKPDIFKATYEPIKEA
jgi:hypothetical protein